MKVGDNMVELEGETRDKALERVGLNPQHWKEKGDEMTFSYISTKPCGCLMLAIVDNPAHKKDTAKEIAKAVRLGETVQRVPSKQVCAMEWHCKDHKPEIWE